MAVGAGRRNEEASPWPSSGNGGSRDPYVTLNSLRRAGSVVNLGNLVDGSRGSGKRRERVRRRGRGRVGSLFRSEDMVLLRLYFENAAAHDTIDELGEVGMCEFRDMNAGKSAFQRTFAADVKRCEEMQRILRFLQTQLREGDVAVQQEDWSAEGNDESFGIRLDDLDTHLSNLERNLSEMNTHWNALKIQQNELLELRWVLERSAEFFHDAPKMSNASNPAPVAQSKSLIKNVLGELSALSKAPTLSGQEEEFGNGHAHSDGEALLRDANANTTPNSASTLLSFFTGTIELSKVTSLERLLFRATRGNCFTRFSSIAEPVVDPETSLPQKKSVFMVFFSGIAVREKISKILHAFGANRYPFPDEHESQMRAYDECRNRLSDLKSVISSTKHQRDEILRDLAANLRRWKEVVRREKGIYHTLNYLNYDLSHKLFIAEVWTPEGTIDDVRAALEIGRRRSSAQVPPVVERRPVQPQDVIPTYYKINKFTSVFQSIVESYGVAQYHEVNPAPYTVITFPFLFAVMFGDIGHGIIMTLFALYIVLNERRMGSRRSRLNEVLQTCFDGRYIILLMGIFSIYTGVIYNEFFAVPLDIFGSRWKYVRGYTMACGIDQCDSPAAVLPPLNVYPFGFDPIWKASKTGLVFFNSYKMKLSIVLGVTQMLLGIFLSSVNAKFFKDKLEYFFVFIPQMIFMTAIFGYLVFLIILKWSINWNDTASSCATGGVCAPPDLKSVLIGIFMRPGTVLDKDRLFSGQGGIQLFLLLAALVAIPWMLFPKPLILRARHGRRRGYLPVENGSDSGYHEEGSHSHGKARFDFAEVFVNQMIHTIEFVLGAVSNTASYLRLWALSLAHAELSNVFLEKLMYGAMSTGNSVVIIIGFFVWIAMTVVVLMLMESLSAFLHALRLHWVEFQNKFYNLHQHPAKKFIPFDHAATRAREEEEDEVT